MRYAAALDIGGTNIKYGVICDSGEVIIRNEIPTEAHLGGNMLMGKIIIIVDKLLTEGYKIDGIGVSSAGQICCRTGKIIYATDNLPGWTGMPIKQTLENKFSIPVHVENDVNAAALGEKWRGAARNYSDFLCLTIGTGIGGAIVINNEIFYGSKGFAGEFGHMIIEKNGIACTCGREGCFEQYASITALIRNVQKKANKKMLETNVLNGKIIFDNAKRGDNVCNEAINEFSKYLAIGLANLLHIFNPPLVVLGGGISAQGAWLLDKIWYNLSEYAMPNYIKNIKICFSECKNTASMLGAVYALFKKLDEI